MFQLALKKGPGRRLRQNMPRALKRRWIVSPGEFKLDVAFPGNEAATCPDAFIKQAVSIMVLGNLLRRRSFLRFLEHLGSFGSKWIISNVPIHQLKGISKLRTWWSGRFATLSGLRIIERKWLGLYMFIAQVKSICRSGKGCLRLL